MFDSTRIIGEKQYTMGKVPIYIAVEQRYSLAVEHLHGHKLYPLLAQCSWVHVYRLTSLTLL